MKLDHWTRMRPLLDHALELDREARCAYLAAIESSDPHLGLELQRLLLEHDSLGDRAMPNAMDLAVSAVADLVREDTDFDDNRVGQSIGPYRLIRLLGAGGMGAVYLAEQVAVGNPPVA